MTRKGVDLSVYQKEIDYSALTDEGVKFAILRAGIGNNKDSALGQHINGLTKEKIPYGYYWYSYAHSVEEAKNEARKCLEVINGYSLPLYPVFYDMEEKSQIKRLDNKTRTDMAIEFFRIIEADGFKAGIYVNPGWMLNYYDKDRLIGKYDIWLASWTDNPNRPTKYDFGQTIWQWGTENIKGGEVDGDVCYIDYPEILKKWYEEKGKEDSIPVVSPDVNTSPFKVGDRVKVSQGAIFSNGVQPFDFVYQNSYDVMQISGDEVLIGQNGEYTGWFNEKDLILVSQKPDTPLFKVGERVRVSQGATTYNGKPLAPFVYTQVYTVIQVGIKDNPDYIVIGQKGRVTAAVNAKNLIKA